jgi:hypothetical protein
MTDLHSDPHSDPHWDQQMDPNSDLMSGPPWVQLSAQMTEQHWALPMGLQTDQR